MKRQLNKIAQPAMALALMMTVAGSAFAAPARESREVRKQEETAREGLRNSVKPAEGATVGSRSLETKVDAAAGKIQREAARTSDGGQGEKAALGIVNEWNKRAELTGEERTAVTKAIAAIKDAKDGEQQRAIEVFAEKEGLDAKEILTECGK